MSEGLAGGDFCATRLPIRITVLMSRCKDKDIFIKHKKIYAKAHQRNTHLV